MSCPVVAHRTGVRERSRSVRPVMATRMVVGLTTVLLGGCGAQSDHEVPTDVLTVMQAGVEGGASGGVTSDAGLAGRPTVTALGPERPLPFSVLARQPRLQRTPCASCHTVPLASMKWSGTDGRARAHWAVSLSHARQDVMGCATCHNSQNLETLRTLNGRAVAFDHAYQVCAQCHTTQAADWVGGAHGKRTGGWAPPRVVYNCTECHNPHSPALPTRWPAHAGRTGQD
jgi:hypothetical protein